MTKIPDGTFVQIETMESTQEHRAYRCSLAFANFSVQESGATSEAALEKAAVTLAAAMAAVEASK